MKNWPRPGVALRIEVEDRPFAKSTLQVFRAGLILHDKVREVFERSLQLARESGYLKGKRMKVALGDAAYGGGKLARPSPTRDAGWWPRRQGVPTGLIFPRTTSGLTWSRTPAPVRRGMSPEPCCQRGNGTAIWIGPIVSSGSMRRVVERASCGCIPRKRYWSKPTPYSRVRPLPNTVAAVWSLSIGWRGWSSSESASPAALDVPRHCSSCTWRPRSLI